MAFRATTTLDKAFEVSILLKGIDGILEIIGGILLLLVSPANINKIATSLTQHELVEDQRDFFASHILQFTHHLTGGALLFGAIYLLSHGIVKIVLIAEILQNRLWAYKGLIVLTIGFIIYQLYRFTYTHSISLILLSVFDVVVVYLTLKEYQKRTG
ncbi:MAG: DUF2127 domain-containing protein [Candidatus Saccharibacteria bacterium]|jgi:uncharacterized membrane protein